jgi:hypothetical protein
MRIILTMMVLVGLACLYQSGKPARERAASREANRSTLAIVRFTDGPDLLRQLKQVKAGQSLQLIDVGTHVSTPVEIPCGDKEALARFRNSAYAEYAQLNAALQAEFSRIRQDP